MKARKERRLPINIDTKIFIAGHRGLVGSAVLRKFQQEGFNHIVLRTRQELDLTEAPAVYDFFRKEQPELVIDAAALVGGILANIQYPADFMRSNLLIQSNLIDAAYRYHAKKFIFLGSSCIYPRAAPQPMKEAYFMTGPLEPTNEAYAIAKIAGIRMCQAYNRQYGTHFVSVMPTNLYGYNDNFDLDTAHVLPANIHKLHLAKIQNLPSVTLWGTGVAQREFMFADDAAAAIFFIAQNYQDGEIINIGTGEEVTIQQLMTLTAEIVGYQGELKWDPSKPDGMPRKWMDVTKLSNLGWQSKIPLRKGIELTYRWFQDNWKPK